MPTFTVFAVYEESHQPYCTTVECAEPEDAIMQAQRACIEDNGGEQPEVSLTLDHGNGYVEIDGYREFALAGFQVVRGEVTVVL